MSFVNNPEYPIEFWMSEMCDLISIRENIQKRESNLKIRESLGEFIGYYELSMSVQSAYNKFKGGI